jgi:hypothetical protein
MKELCVVHLVRFHNGVEPFRRFLESYRKNSGGIDHDLLIIFKGFNHPTDIKEYECLLDYLQYSKLELSDEGFDITAYFKAVRHYADQYSYFCFLNSFSVIQDSQWLRKLYDNILLPGVGLVGASGSWNSNHSNACNWFLSIGGGVSYLRHKKYIKPAENQLGKFSKIRMLVILFDKIITGICEVPDHVSELIYFDAFPNYHIRTNAFMISGEFMMTLECPKIKTKFNAYRFENGKKGLTKQVIEMGKKVVVVGRDGVGYEKETWNISKTFWRYNQENLLVADNQTQDYQDGTKERREFLSSIAWGHTE